MWRVQSILGRRAAAVGAVGFGSAVAGRFAFCEKQPSVPTWTADDLKYAGAVRTVRTMYAMPTAAMAAVREHFGAEAEAGLAGTPSSLPMLPTFVNSRVTGEEKGHFFALDLGGTNFRVLRFTLEGGGRVGDLKQGKYSIPDSIKQGTGKELFGFIADSVARFLALECDGHVEGNIGFTFSFPVEQTAIDHGKLLFWNKNFTASDVVGRDVVALLHEQFEERGIKLVIKALTNDTVGTLEAAAYSDAKALVGVIIGTGTNACYLEKTKRVPKWSGAASEEMVINCEWGNLDMRRFMNEHDVLVDGASSNAGRMTYEKMSSGLYLGELCQLAVTDPRIAVGLSPDCRAAVAASFGPPGSFSTAAMAACEGDETAQLDGVERVLREAGVRGSSLRDRTLLREVCVAVSTRAARLSASSVVGVMDRVGEVGDVTVAVDGTVFECYPRFKERMEEGIVELLGAPRAKQVKLVLAKDGSGIGAAITAAISS